MRTVSEGEETPFPQLLEEGMGYIHEMLTEGIKYTGDARKDREMIRQRDRRQKLRQEKYIELLEDAIQRANLDWMSKIILSTARHQSEVEADRALEEEAK